MHQYTMTKDEPLFRQAKANADLLSAVSSATLKLQKVPSGLLPWVTPEIQSTDYVKYIDNLL